MTSKSTEKKAAKPAAEKKTTQKTATSGLKKPLTCSPQLSAVIGDKPMPRTEMVKKIWDYIKKNKLQDKENKQMINADKLLKPLFDGKDQISMFQLAKVVSNNIK